MASRAITLAEKIDQLAKQRQRYEPNLSYTDATLAVIANDMRLSESYDAAMAAPMAAVKVSPKTKGVRADDDVAADDDGAVPCASCGAPTRAGKFVELDDDVEADEGSQDSDALDDEGAAGLAAVPPKLAGAAPPALPMKKKMDDEFAGRCSACERAFRFSGNGMPAKCVACGHPLSTHDIRSDWSTAMEKAERIVRRRMSRQLHDVKL